MGAVPSERLVLTIGCPEAREALEGCGLRGRNHSSWADCRAGLPEPGLRAIIFRAGGDSSSLSEHIARARQELPLVDVLVWAPDGHPEDVRRALQSGAVDVALSRAPTALARAAMRIIDQQRFLPRLQRFEQTRARGSRFEGLVSKSARMWELFKTVTQVAPSGASVLILGETGVGKDLLARAIHKYSGRAGRFVAVNCGAIPEPLIDSELFGHEEGTFTGATRNKDGLFRSADGGTLFLDEVANLPLTSQYSFLRALQAEAVRPVGGHREIPVDCRIIAATSRPLDQVARRGLFREDLLYRLDVIRLVIPTLRERPEDVLHLFSYFRRKIAKKYRLEPPQTSDAFLESLLVHDWPGNVRELENLVERLTLTHHGKRLTARSFESLKRPYLNPGAAPPELPAKPPDSRTGAVDLSKSLKDTIEPATLALERQYLDAALADNRGRVGDTARLAGISPRTLLRKMKQHGLDKHDYRRG